MCPQTAPAEWHVADGKLRAVLVLSVPAGQAINEDAPPSIAPTREWRTKGYFHQSWVMNVEAPKFSDKVDCIYTGTERHLRLDAYAVKQCTAHWTASPQGLIATSLVFQCR